MERIETMKISKQEAVAFFEALQFENAAEWPDKKLASRFSQVSENVTPEDVPEDWVALYEKIVEGAELDLESAPAKKGKASKAVAVIEPEVLEEEKLDSKEAKEFIELEKVAENAKENLELSVREFGAAISEISERKLYRAEFKTFDMYVKNRWGMSARRAYQICDAGKTANLLGSIRVTVATEAVGREFAGLTDEEKIEAGEALVKKGKTKPNRAEAKEAAMGVSDKKREQEAARQEREDAKKREAAEKESKKALAEKEKELAAAQKAHDRELAQLNLDLRKAEKEKEKEIAAIQAKHDKELEAKKADERLVDPESPVEQILAWILKHRVKLQKLEASAICDKILKQFAD